jgi:hypothetical protein
VPIVLQPIHVAANYAFVHSSYHLAHEANPQDEQSRAPWLCV